ncbi:ZIP family metal transporter [Geotoga petraea]|jgi:ZIP family zinc transporter|uniref:ZIP family metal transporter n=1 Tax=Geotoga petraea TaxID=28234 RepID=A0A1G6K6D6_9BACT|nr:ZIP family metal transporter [Geotoga petraea]MDK2945788.1 zinc transporter, family [Geotoga sp.]TGG88435.1 ZIP family metal transporter [Geotoga petraea]SDC26401.1 zinc transporter, ZIP family [Geotoga petraea]
MENLNVFVLGSLASLIAGLATSLGAIPVLFLKKQPSEKQLDMYLAFASGVMLAATMFSLIVPSIDIGGPLIMVIGVVLGAVTIELFDVFSPHEHFLKGHEGPNTALVKKVWLFVIAITLHNFPEGMAVGVSFGGEMIKNGLVVATAIGIQNIPEGTATAFSFIQAGYSKKRSFFMSTLTGLVEPLGGILGASLVVFMKPALPFFLAFAAGAMLYVISDEIIPETHSHGNERIATFSLIVGFLLMTVLDNTLG